MPSRIILLDAPSRFLVLVLVLVLVLAPASPALADGAPPPEACEDVYLTQPAALRQLFPEDEAAAFESAELAPTPAERGRIERRLGARIFERGFTVHRAVRKDGAIAGYAVVTEEIGKYRPITFVVGVTPESTVKQVAVMVYRESHGSDVKRRRFLAQFDGKRTGDPIRQNKDILNVSGATLSVRSVARGVRKVLLAVDELLIGAERRAAVAWRPVSFAGAEARPAGRETGCAPIRRAGYLMGTVLEATVYPEGGAGAAEAAGRATAAAFEEVVRLERLMSTFIAESELSRVNRDAVRAPTAVSPDTFACIAAAIDVARRSGGAFDPTLRAGGWERVRLDPEARTVAFTAPPARPERSEAVPPARPERSEAESKGAPPPSPLTLDLGGIAKGYALDRAAAILRARGASRALLNFGGQVLALDPPPGEAAWVVAVEDPRAPDGPALGFFRVANASVSTSSQAERLGHIRDPRTGRAAEATLSATIRAPSAILADALSTAAFVLGPERGRALAATEPGAESLLLAP